MTNRIMLDLETLGTKPGSVILAIGAVRFDETGILGESFYQNVNPESAVEAGLTIDVSTIMWWLQQSDEARKGLVAGEAMLLPQALHAFGRWALAPGGVVNSHEDIVQVEELWGNGSDFDNVLLAHAFTAAGLPQPWSHRANRDYRTLRALAPDVPFMKPVVAHNALEDAKAQAVHAIEILKVLKGGATELPAGTLAAVEGGSDGTA